MFGFWLVAKPTYPPASAGELITKVTCSLDNGITCAQNTDQVIIDPQLAVAFEKKETARIAAEKKRLAQRRVLTVKTTPYNACSCVSYVQKFYPGVRTANGWAITFPVNSQTPTVGAVVVTYESSYGSFRTGHVGIVSAIENGSIKISEANFSRCRVTYGRQLPVGSPLIKGYFQPL